MKHIHISMAPNRPQKGHVFMVGEPKQGAALPCSVSTGHVCSRLVTIFFSTLPMCRSTSKDLGLQTRFLNNRLALESRHIIWQWHTVSLPPWYPFHAQQVPILENSSNDPIALVFTLQWFFPSSIEINALLSFRIWCNVLHPLGLCLHLLPVTPLNSRN